MAPQFLPKRRPPILDSAPPKTKAQLWAVRPTARTAVEERIKSICFESRDPPGEP